MDHAELTDFATRYAAAWSSQDPGNVAAFYAVDGALVVNNGAMSVGRDSVASLARAFMTGFPDMVVRLDRVVVESTGPVFHWIWTGTNTGPGGTGRPVNMRGYEEWTLTSEGLIALSQGHYDEAEYRRQVAG